MIDLLIRFGVFVVVLILMLMSIEWLVPIKGPPARKFDYTLEYLTQKTKLRD
jgi:hypothetical protein